MVDAKSTRYAITVGTGDGELSLAGKLDIPDNLQVKDFLDFLDEAGYIDYSPLQDGNHVVVEVTGSGFTVLDRGRLIIQGENIGTAKVLG